MDGRALYIRYRHGELTVGAGPKVADAVGSSAGRSPLHSAELGGSLDGYMTFSELKEALQGVLDFPDNLIVQEERALAISLPPRRIYDGA